ncbi:MAG: flavin reductase family protein [Sphingomonadaceae bacterium]|nr:flavin reductase family protein [Sphingomonadaceae bacterium]MCP5390872.1 flavin reductase family protein [Sphingomonadaceae bacterium]MCP5394628.1 flavin reductase family protein [Sphingomonadaceae bacterium]
MSGQDSDGVSTDFRLALRGIAATVCIVATTDGTHKRGMTVTSVTSVSLDPPAILVCVNKSASINEILRVADGFSVNILSSAQQAVSNAFSGALSAEERFEVGDWQEDPRTGLPYLADAQSTILCNKSAAFPIGTHMIVVGDVSRVASNQSCDPLIYHNADYAALTK